MLCILPWNISGCAEFQWVNECGHILCGKIRVKE